MPGKSMAPLAGKPLLHRLLERVKRATRLDDIVVAIPDRPEDDVLVKVAIESDVRVFRGSEDDLVDRYYRAARDARADVVLRLPADNPVPEPSEFDRIVEYHLSGQADFSSNLAQVLGNGYPDGIGAEVFNTADLEEIWRTTTDPERREHPHLNFFNYKTQTPASPRYRVGTVPCPPAFRRPDLVLDVNTREEYEFMAALYAYLYPRNPSFHIIDVIHWHDTVYRASAGGAVQRS